jgi:type IV pilus assembly protein PilB
MSTYNDQKIAEILLRENYISREDLDNATTTVSKNKSSLIDYLISSGLITNQLLGQAVAESINLPFADLASRLPTRDQVLMTPEEVAKKYRFTVFTQDNDSITLATDNPELNTKLKVITDLFGKRKINIAFALTKELDEAFDFYRKPLSTRFTSIIKDDQHVAPELIDEIFKEALSYHASDIHFEPQENDDVVIRFRVDGVLNEAGRIPKEFYKNVVNLIKVMSRLRVDEHTAIQDGAIRYEKDEKIVDMRISIAPILDGEKIVIRLLAEYIRGFSLEDIGLSPSNQKKISDAAKKPFGMILVSGPTGSGKTTTLYSLLKLLNRGDVNITTIEDPVEYRIAGANQIQVDAKIDLTFARGLRSIIRQDPNIILVGEIRDKETAEIAVNAALTGHLLFSTFHANDAATAIPRLQEMGAEPFLLASTLEMLVSQRLVRKICESCRYSQEVERDTFAPILPNITDFFASKTITIYRGKGCNTCNQTGYKGRSAIFEIIDITPEMKDLILTHPSSKQIWELASSQGSITMFQDGILKVEKGVTTLEEVIRVASPTIYKKESRG